MKQYNKLKIAIIGAGSVSFCPGTLADILLSEPLSKLPVEISLMDIDEQALEVSGKYAQKVVEASGKDVKVSATLDLDKAIDGADFVITAVELDRTHYWSMDFHIPRRYGFRQIFGENGGPGGMFHTLRNLPPVLNIARAMRC